MLHIKKLKPLSTYLLTTANKYEEDMRENGLIIATQGDLKLYQNVLEVGPMVRDIKPGDQVMIDPKNYMVMKYDPNSIKNDMDMNKVVKWNFPFVDIDDEEGKPKECLLLTDRDIKFVFVGEEKNETIIIPDKPKIILN